VKSNLGTIDSVIRIAIGAVIIGLYFANIVSGLLAIALLVLAAILMITSVVSFCPIYAAFGLSTIKKENKKT